MVWGSKQVSRAISTVARRGDRSPMASKLLSVIFSFYFGIALLVTCIQLLLEYKNERARLGREIEATVQLVQPVLSKTLWDLDKSGTTATLDGLARNPSLVGIQLDGRIPVVIGRIASTEDGTGDLSANTPMSQLYEQSFVIGPPASEGSGESIATLKVYSSSDTVLQRSITALVTLAASALVKTLALWLILYLAIKNMMARPLIRLADRLNNVKNDHDTVNSARHWRDAPSVNELTFTLRSFASMRRALQKSRHALLTYQQELEQKIGDRTRELHYLATHDELTKLLNRRAFESAFTTLMSRCANGETRGVLCLIDLDHFKLVNDRLGHAAGDKVLRQIAEILLRNSRTDDIVARMGGDEFAIILTNCTVGEAQAKMQAMEREAHGLLIEKDGVQARIGLSAGLVDLSSGTAGGLSHAMANADAACYAAKQAGRHQAKVFGHSDPALRRKHDINWVSVIHLALSEERLLLYAQPILSTTDRKMRGIEVLVRMLLDGQVLTPDHFIPAALRHGLMTKIDEWVVSRTLSLLAATPAALEQLDRVHINLSTGAICDPAFYRFVVRQLKLHPVPTTRLCFEVPTSGALMGMDRPARIMKGLRARGVRFALDDFGNSMTSNSPLQATLIDCVKIDGALVCRMGDDPVSAALVAAINKISHMEGVRTVAAFVEDEASSGRLAAIGVDQQQGYHLAMPAPIIEVLTGGAATTV